MMGEHAIIARYFAPLVTDAGAFGLRDDVAVLPAMTTPWAITVDGLIEDVHFLSDDPLDLVARKLLRRNISDLVGKGCRPMGYLLSLQWPRHRDPALLQAFVEGLAQDQAAFGLSLFGGDTAMTDGPFSAQATVFGSLLGASIVPRDGAMVGDDVYVTGRLGDAGLGLQVLRGEALPITPSELDHVVAAYRLPEPPFSFASALARLARASIDLSDGLGVDGARMAALSHVDLELWPDQIPLSVSGRAVVTAAKDGAAALASLLAFGDDYQVLFTAAPDDRDSLLALADAAEIRLTRIGTCIAGRTTPGHVWLGDDDIASQGYDHGQV